MYKMLIVDDEKVERACIRYLVESAGIPLELKEAPDAQSALSILAQWPADILFTDVQMPVTSGLELAGEASRLLPGIKTIIFSSYADFEYARTAMTLKAENYILKPVVPEELEKVLYSVIHVLDRERGAKIHPDTIAGYNVPAVDGQPGESFEVSGAGLRREVLTTQEYIGNNYHSELSVEMLAAHVYLTPDYLSRLFKKSTGQSLNQYIRRVRMERAKQLLCTTSRKVIDIGADVGYPNYSYFCQSFREYFGKSPDRYRQEEVYEPSSLPFK